jgi:hypothetical protein
MPARTTTRARRDGWRQLREQLRARGRLTGAAGKYRVRRCVHAHAHGAGGRVGRVGISQHVRDVAAELGEVDLIAVEPREPPRSGPVLRRAGAAARARPVGNGDRGAVLAHGLDAQVGDRFADHAVERRITTQRPRLHCPPRTLHRRDRDQRQPEQQRGRGATQVMAPFGTVARVRRSATERGRDRLPVEQHHVTGDQAQERDAHDPLSSEMKQHAARGRHEPAAPRPDQRHEAELEHDHAERRKLE